MFSKNQEQALKQFADFSDKLFELGVTTTDSFTGEIGEYVACRYFNLDKSARVTRAVDGVSKTGDRYQVKAKVVSKDNFNYSFKDLEHTLFDFLAIVYFDRNYNPLKIFRIPSKLIIDGEFRFTASTSLTQIDVIDKSEIRIPSNIKNAINDFAKSYNDLETNGIIRSRRIVGDIGEFYACRKLNLEISNNKTEKGIDARHSNGLTFEIKTRRVYQSGRRTGEARRLNNLDGKSADYLIVVALDRAFACAGMWIIPMRNILNPKSAHLTIVNNTIGTKNLIPSGITGLNTGERFTSFDKIRANAKKEIKTKLISPTISNRKPAATNRRTKLTQAQKQANSGCLKIILIVIALCIFFYIIGKTS